METRASIDVWLGGVGEINQFIFVFCTARRSRRENFWNKSSGQKVYNKKATKGSARTHQQQRRQWGEKINKGVAASRSCTERIQPLLEDFVAVGDWGPGYTSLGGVYANVWHISAFKEDCICYACVASATVQRQSIKSKHFSVRFCSVPFFLVGLVAGGRGWRWAKLLEWEQGI